MDVYQNLKGNAWPEEGRKHFQWPPEKTSGKFWLWTNAPYPCAVETHLPWNRIHPHDGWFWGEVHKQARCGAPQKCPANIIPHDHILDRVKKLGLTLNWDYINRTFDLSMPNYVLASPQKFQNKVPYNPHNAPHHWAGQTYGQKTQHTNTEGKSPLLPPKQIYLVQKFVVTFLYYSLDVNSTMLVALGDLA